MCTSHRMILPAAFMALFSLTIQDAVSQSTRSDTPWTWSTETVLQIVNQVRAGKHLQPATWPIGAIVDPAEPSCSTFYHSYATPNGSGY